MPNELAHETSPYLQQNANNPVDWHFTCQTPVIGKEAARKTSEKLAMVGKGT